MTEIDLLRKKISEDRQQFVEAMTYGEPPDYAQYQRYVGVVQGFDKALAYIEDLVKLMEEQDDDN